MSFGTRIGTESAGMIRDSGYDTNGRAFVLRRLDEAEAALAQSALCLLERLEEADTSARSRHKLWSRITLPPIRSILTTKPRSARRTSTCC
jgi:hypothetical protein